jgi:hypothetical protein
MPQQPIAEGAQGRSGFARRISNRSDGALLSEILGEALNTCCKGSRNLFMVTASRTFAVMCSECLDGIVVNIHEMQAPGLHPPTEVNG